MTVAMHGIPNCDTVKKARAWLDAHGVDYTFHDFKKAGVDEAMLRGWLAQVPLATLLNRQGTTWRKLPAEQQDQAGSETGAIALMIAQPSVIKRPVLVSAGCVTVGFKPDLYQALFSA